MHYGILHPTYPIKQLPCVIKLHMKLLTPNLPLSNCVIKLRTKLHVHKASVVSSSYSSWHMHVFPLQCLDTTDILSLPIFFMCYAAGM